MLFVYKNQKIKKKMLMSAKRLGFPFFFFLAKLMKEG